MKNKIIISVFLVLYTFPLFSLSVNIRAYDHSNYTRVVFEGNQAFQYKFEQSKAAVTIKLDQKARLKKNIKTFDSILIDRVSHHFEEGTSVFQVQLKSSYNINRNFVLERPFRVVFDLSKSEGNSSKEENVSPQSQPLEEKNNSQLDQENLQEDKQDEPKEGFPLDKPGKKRELIRVICLDPGHGGADLGAVGRTKLLEKDITLEVARKLKRKIVSKLGLRVVMTRDKDEEVSLNSRVAQANNQKAQMFVSIHVNSSFRKAASGPETYYVSLKATDQEAFQLSQKENNVFKEEIDKLADNDELKMILWDMAQNEFIKESARLADFIQYELNILMHTRNRGVKQAPFRVLMRAAMPAVLVEIAFISNSKEEKKLSNNSFLDQVASSIYSGIAKYIYYHNNLYK